MSDYDDGWLDCARAFGLDRAEVLSGRNEIERLRAELALDEERLLSRWYQKRAEKAEAAIARVRELCEGWPSWREVTAAEVLRALDGGE